MSERSGLGAKVVVSAVVRVSRGGGFRGGPGVALDSAAVPAGGGSSMGLLRIEEVQTELEIRPAQKEALDKLAEQGRG